MGMDYLGQVRYHECRLEIQDCVSTDCRGCGAVVSEAIAILSAASPRSRLDHVPQELTRLCRSCASELAIMILEREWG